MSAAAAVVRLDRRRAELLTARLREVLDLAVDLVAELYRCEGWRAMGYDSWSAYCRTELPQLAVIVKGLPREERQAKVAALRADGQLSLRAAAELTGLSPNTVKADTAAAGLQLVAVTRSSDGAVMAAAAPAAARRRGPRKTDRTVELLAAAGPDGLTVRDVARALRCPQHMAAATLTRLVQSARVVYLSPARRGLFGRYVVRLES